MRSASQVIVIVIPLNPCVHGYFLRKPMYHNGCFLPGTKYKINWRNLRVNVGERALNVNLKRPLFFMNSFNDCPSAVCPGESILQVAVKTPCD